MLTCQCTSRTELLARMQAGLWEYCKKEKGYFN